MSEKIEFVVRAVVLGVGATLVMDGWALVLKQFGIPSLNFALLGRWVGHLRFGKVVHAGITKSPAVKGELFLGWVVHYSIGVAFAALLLAVAGVQWASAPTLAPALAVGVLTVVAPLFVLQPALGSGIASSKTSAPVFNSLKSVVTHTVYGVGLYLTAMVVAAVWTQ